jgi:hypothetical protein
LGTLVTPADAKTASLRGWHSSNAVLGLEMQIQAPEHPNWLPPIEQESLRKCLQEKEIAGDRIRTGDVPLGNTGCRL